VLERPGVRLDWSALDRLLPELRERVDWLIGPSMLISATMVRQFAAAYRSLRYLIPDPVYRYIIEHHLYTAH
jgi:nicotinate-nucleotide adenylyltransferase